MTTAHTPILESIVDTADKAAFIVRACNAHEDLVAAFRSIVTATSKEGSKPSAEIIEFCFQAARAALAKAAPADFIDSNRLAP
jgi:hypothetical protein